MDSFAPELSRAWQSSQDTRAEAADEASAAAARAEELALEELAERVSAARSVV